MSLSYFVTGTDTEVGKTVITAGLLRAFARTGRSAVGMKPVAAGREDGRFADVDAHRAASSVAAPAHLVNPYAFDPPIAPHIAAELAGVAIRIDTIVAAHRELRPHAEVVLAEGAGGFMIPLDRSATSAELAQALGTPVILVVGVRLGCLNHALLTQEAIAARSLRFAGWVANCIVADMPYREQNIATLRERLRAPCLGVVPHGATQPDEVAQRLDLAPLLA